MDHADVIVVEEGVVAEAIGEINADGSAGQLFDILACNIQDPQSAACLMVDYDGTSTKSKDSLDVTDGKTSTFPIQGAAPSGLSQYAAGVMAIQIATADNKGVSGSSGGDSSDSGEAMANGSSSSSKQAAAGQSAYKQQAGSTGTPSAGSSTPAASTSPGTSDDAGSADGTGTIPTQVAP